MNKQKHFAFKNKQTTESSDYSLVCQLLSGSVCCERGMVLLQGVLSTLQSLVCSV